MSFQRWRWWQWTIASLLVGGLLGFAFTRFDIDDTSIATRDLGFMLRLINQKTDTGDSIVDGIRVSPPVVDVRGKSMENVTFWVRQKNKTTGTWDRTEQYQVRVNNPIFNERVATTNYASMRDYLAEKKKEIPSLDFRFNFYQKPEVIWALSLGGSFVGIGILLPILIRAMVKMGLGLPEIEDEKGVDLSRVSSRGASSPAFAGVGVTDADRDELAALNEKLESNVSDMLIQQDELDEEEERKAEEAVVKKLTGTTLVDEGAPTQSDASREYGGEFYPVVRPGGGAKKDEEQIESEK